MGKVLVEKISLKVLPGESQFQFMRRALAILAAQADLPPSEQLTFVDRFAPASMNTSSFKLEWANGDPTPKDNSSVKKSEFNSVRGRTIEFSLTEKQKEYLTKKRRELIKNGIVKPNILLDGASVYGSAPNGGFAKWYGRVNVGESKLKPQQIKNTEPSEKLKKALRALETQALNFSLRFINDAKVRRDYQRQTKEVAEEILASFMRGDLNEKQASATAHGLRNKIMEAARLKTSDIGRAYAESKKAGSRPLNYYEKRYANKKFGKPFSKLTPAQRNVVWLEIVKGSARPNAPISKTTVRLNRLGKGLLVVSVAIAVYNIGTAEDKVKATAKEGTTLLGGIAGGAAGGAVAGLACGPGAPVW